MSKPDGLIGRHLADALNRDCHCISVDKLALHHQLGSHLSGSGLPAQFLEAQSHLFADLPVFLWDGHIEIMQAVIRAVERVALASSYRDEVLPRAPPGACEDFGPRGVFLPTTLIVSEENSDQLWKDRKQLFFKPVSGYGSRGAYRGAKLTRRVWHDIVHADYVAQAIVPPSERKLILSGEERSLKLDIRCVSYNSKIQQLSARLYRGQTTNLRTEGGGLATVFATPKGSC